MGDEGPGGPGGALDAQLAELGPLAVGGPLVRHRRSISDGNAPFGAMALDFLGGPTPEEAEFAAESGYLGAQGAAQLQSYLSAPLVQPARSEPPMPPVLLGGGGSPLVSTHGPGVLLTGLELPLGGVSGMDVEGGPPQQAVSLPSPGSAPLIGGGPCPKSGTACGGPGGGAGRRGEGREGGRGGQRLQGRQGGWSDQSRGRGSEPEGGAREQGWGFGKVGKRRSDWGL